MVAPGLAASERAEQGKRLKALGEEVDALEQRWLELTEAIEAGAAATS
jgi:ATP-binding cassette subfamily F protein 3